jgi:hypothetical protein
MVTIVTILFSILGIYLAAGLLFAVIFLIKGIERVDASAHGATWGFKLIIIPGIMALWPVLLNKWIKAKPVNHDETTA